LFTLLASGTKSNTADEADARTMAFTTLVMFQLFNVFNCRSTWRSPFSGPLDNRWLIVAIAISLFAHTLVTYVPVLRTAFRTVPLTMTDLLVTTTIAATLIVVAELIKSATRMKSRRALAALRGD
jgi:Ca2+-transporting ATPase